MVQVAIHQMKSIDKTCVRFLQFSACFHLKEKEEFFRVGNPSFDSGPVLVTSASDANIPVGPVPRFPLHPLDALEMIKQTGRKESHLLPFDNESVAHITAAAGGQASANSLIPLTFRPVFAPPSDTCCIRRIGVTGFPPNSRDPITNQRPIEL